MWDKALKEANKKTIPRLAAALWGADRDSVKFINAGDYFVYQFKCRSKRKYLRITHPMMKSRAEMAAAIDYQRHLFETGAPICEPVKSHQGNYIEEITLDNEPYFMHVNDEVQGEFIDFDHSDKQVFLTWGKSLAHLHRAAKNYHPHDHHRFLDWHDGWDEVGRNVQNENEAIQQEYEAIDDWINTLSKTQHNFGLIHGDLCTGNVLYDGRKIRMIDLDEPIYHWYWADIARPFLEQSPTKFHQWKQKAVWFLEGYATILPFDEDMISYLPWFIRMKNMDIYLSLKNGPAASDSVFANDRLAELCEYISNPLISWDL